MFNTFEIIYSVLLFWAIYFQVFFLVVFFDKKKEIEEEDIMYDDHQYPSVSFLIPCWNEQETVAQTINSVLGVDYPTEKLKIHVIDDGSTDKTWERLQLFRNHPQVYLIKKENGGKHSALNLALKSVKTDLVISFDADTRIDPQALKRSVAYFIKDKELMALGGTVLIEKPKTFVQRAQSIEYQIFSFTKKMLGLIGGVLVAPGAFSIFKREVFEKIGDYSNAYNLEDVEFTLRMQSQKMKIGHCHTAIVTTKGPDSVRKLFKQRLRWCYGFMTNVRDYSKLIFSREHGNFGILTLPMNIFAYVMVTFVFFLGLYRLLMFIYGKIIEISVVGFRGLSSLGFDSFFINTKPTTFLAIIIYVFILLGIYMGKRISKIEKTDLLSILYFIMVYSVLSPVWVLKSVYNWATARSTSWR